MANTHVVSFDGVNGQISIADNNFDGLAAGTIEFWIRRGTVSTNEKLVFKNAAIDIGLDGNGAPFGEIGGVGNLGVFGGERDDSLWHHIAMTWDGTWLRGYVDGIYYARTAQLATQTNNANTLFLGRRDTTEPYAGLLNEFRLSNTARYTTETSFSIPTAEFVDDANTLILLHLNDGTGTNANDSSSSNNDGTLAGGASWSTESVLTGTVTASISEGNIVSGGKIIILTLTNNTWVEYSGELTTGGTATASGENLPDEGVAKAFDDSSSTKWLVFATTGWIQYRFAASATHLVTKYALTSGNDDATRDPKDWTLQGSNNGTTWTTVDTVTGELFASRGLRKEFICDTPGSTAYEYFRLDITLNNGSGSIIQLAELQLYKDRFLPERQNIINGLDSAQAEGTGWDAVVKATQGVAGVVRTSDTVATITLDAFPTYNISTTETITATIPTTALTSGIVIEATPTFAIAASIPNKIYQTTNKFWGS